MQYPQNYYKFAGVYLSEWFICAKGNGYYFYWQEGGGMPVDIDNSL
jgi:hypothetical protein